MPVVSVSRNALFQILGKVYTEEEFYDLCFEFGIELDDVEKDPVNPNDQIYKIEVGANRYDLLCLEGLSRALSLFIGHEKKLPIYTAVKPDNPYKMIVKDSVIGVRQFVVCAILRNFVFTQEVYQSFIDLQDKLHHNICRRRTLVSIGTHDLDTIQGPFSYEALPPKEINFVPLNRNKSVDGEQLMTLLDSDLHLKHYLHIIRNKPTYPVIYDSKRVVLSLPPIINGEHSKITLNTKNILIEVTATDLTKANIVLETMTSMFGQYTKIPFQVEKVEVYNETTGQSVFTPEYENREVRASLNYVEGAIGVKIPKDKVKDYLTRMSLPSTIDAATNSIVVQVPPTRSDILEACDVMEDVAIGFGFNKILDSAKPPLTLTVGAQQPINKLSDQLREEIAQAGYTEVLTLSLCSVEEAYAFLRKPDDGLAVKLANPMTLEYQIGRTNLLVGVLKTLNQNKHINVPIKLFEISDVMHKAEGYDVGACNTRTLCAVYMNTSAGFEHIHGLLDRIMLLLEVPKVEPGSVKGYYIRESKDETFFPGMTAEVVVNGSPIGIFGVIHPEVLKNYDIPFPASALHITIESFL